MTRILADLSDDDIGWLDRLAEEQGTSRAALLREAVTAFRSDASGDWIDQGFGIWKAAADFQGGVMPQAWAKADVEQKVGGASQVEQDGHE